MMTVEDDPFATPPAEEGETTAPEAPAAEEVAPESEASAEEAAGDHIEAPVAPVETPAVEEPAAHDAPDPEHEEEPAEDFEPLEDRPVDPGALGAAPARLHSALVDQLSLRWHEVKEFVSRLDGETGDRELDDVLACARHYLKV